MTFRLLAAGLAFVLTGAALAQTPKLEAISFASRSDEVYVSIRETATALNTLVGWDDAKNTVLFNNLPVKGSVLRRIEDSQAFIPLSALEQYSVKVTAGAETDTYVLEMGDKKAEVVLPRQMVEVNLKDQELRAWQGKWLVLRTHVSSGKRGFGTPTGSYSALAKSRHRVSRKYANAPMPYSVQIWGGYFLHGSQSVPGWPASHGCVRLPLEGRNPASLLFDWINVGTPVKVTREWSPEARVFDGSDA